LSTPYITEECLKKLDTKQQTNTLLNLVWRDSASEEVFTRMASVCHTLMVQHRMMVPRVRQVSSLVHYSRVHCPCNSRGCALQWVICWFLTEEGIKHRFLQALLKNTSLVLSSFSLGSLSSFLNQLTLLESFSWPHVQYVIKSSQFLFLSCLA
jgi:hypothetical protein